MPKPPAPTSRYWKLHRQLARLNTFLFRRTRGKVGGSFLGGAPVLLLDHIGRRSGQARTSPLIYLDDAPRLVVVASKGGVDAHPAWFHNLMAMAATEVELPGGERRRVPSAPDRRCGTDPPVGTSGGDLPRLRELRDLHRTADPRGRARTRRVTRTTPAHSPHAAGLPGRTNRVTDQVPGSRTIRHDGPGHNLFAGMANACVIDHVSRYVADRELPTADALCPP
ncbi:nitroreductase/quinone reductase family protein [Amycolatopsis magusensis]